MLVLSRRVNESLQIGPEIIVTVTRIGSDRVRLGITAPSKLKVLRTEIGSINVTTEGFDADERDENEAPA